MNVKVVIQGRTSFFNEIMDDSAVAAYITAASVSGHFISSDSKIYIPYGIAEIVIQEEAYTQASRQEANNFGPSNLY